MKIVSSTIQQYTLPLTRPLTTDTSQTTRQGLVLTLESDTALKGYGEISPLQGLHKENLSEATKQLWKCRSHFPGISITDDMLSFNGGLSKGLPINLYPSVRCGIEMAILDLVVQTEGLPFPLPEALPVNALLVPNDKSIGKEVDQLLSQGFSCLKMKVARGPLEKDIEAVNTVLSQIQGTASLRLDANRGWILQQAQQFCNAIDLQSIEYIEEPTQNPADHARLNPSGDVPIALDETLAETDCEQLDKKYYRAVVLKPSVLGGFEKTAQIVRWAQQHHLTPVISSAFQTSLATRMYLIFAALNGITQTPLGLDTLKWFQEDLLSTPLEIEAGKIALRPLAVRPKLRQDVLISIETIC